MKFTVLGANGFVGSNLMNYLNEQNIEAYAPPRDFIFNSNDNLGHVIYCIGLTSDFRTRPIETVQAHVCKLIEVIQNAKFDSLVYLSSTRVYMRNNAATEESFLKVNTSDFSDLYNLSKLMGESICLSLKDLNIKVARLSNVIGNDFQSDNLLFSLIKDAVDHKHLSIGIRGNSVKDYVSINDVVKLLTQIAISGKQKIYNVGSGINISVDDIVSRLKEKTGCSLSYTENALDASFPSISVDKIKKEFNFVPTNVLNEIGGLIETYNKYKNDTNRQGK
jgi:nucleoside-diphosphate-sugar epimerase